MTIIKEIAFDMYSWTITQGEYIVGLPVGLAIVQPVNYGNEFIHFGFQVIATVSSAYAIHRLKKYWATKKK